MIPRVRSPDHESGYARLAPPVDIDTIKFYSIYALEPGTYASFRFQDTPNIY